MVKDEDGQIQFVFVNVKGNQATLQEALRQVGTVINRGMNSAPRTLVAMPTSKALPLGPSGNGDNIHEVYEVVDEEARVMEAEGASGLSANTDSKQKRVKKAPRIPALLKDFDPNAEVSFSDFTSRKDTSTHFNKYLVIGAWFNKYKGENSITTSHIYTCYQLMHWSAPDDMTQAFRDMKRKHSYFEKERDQKWAITIIGVNEVDKMVPKNEKE